MATYKVKDDGKAPSGLSTGDTVVTGGGTYKITGVNSDGSYQSTKVNNTNTSNYSGAYASAPSTTKKPTASNYTPTGTYNDAGVSTADQAKIQAYKEQYAAAQANGDTAAMAAAHAAAEAIRGRYNYSGGTDGSEYNPFDEPLTPTFSYNVAQPTYNSKYDNRIDQMLNQILNRDAFTYDAVNDPLYQQYRDQYVREGNRSMNDTLAAAASGAGGMNSYAITAAQQASDYYAAQLNDKIPELYQLAYDMYLTDIDNQVRDLGLLQQMDETQYGRYRDQMSDWRNDRDFAYGMYRDDVGDNKWYDEFDQSVYTDLRNYNYGVGRDKVTDAQWDKSFGLEEDKFADSTKDDAWDRAMTIILNGGTPSAELLKAAGMTEAEAQSLKDAQIAAAPAGGSGGGGNGGGSGKKGDDDDDGDDVPIFDNKPTGGDFIDKHAAAVKAAPDRTSFDTSDLSANGKKALSSLSMMYDSMSNQYAGKDGLYPVEKTILEMAAEGSITADDGYILMQHFGYNGEKHFPEE